MSVYCPRTGKKVVYLTCMECDTRYCDSENSREYSKPVYKTTPNNNNDDVKNNTKEKDDNV